MCDHYTEEEYAKLTKQTDETVDRQVGYIVILIVGLLVLAWIL